MTGKRKILLTVLSLLLVCNLAFIWGNSLVSRSLTPTTSAWECWAFCPDSSGTLFPNQEQLVHIVRKMAHFTEFACLGGLSCGCWPRPRTVKLHPFFHVWAGGFFVAAIDETIQIFTGRGSQLQDVWLDFAGFSAGLLAVLLIRALVLRSKPEESPKEVDNVIAFPKGHDAFKHLHSSGKS